MILQLLLICAVVPASCFNGRPAAKEYLAVRSKAVKFSTSREAFQNKVWYRFLHCCDLSAGLVLAAFSNQTFSVTYQPRIRVSRGNEVGLAIDECAPEDSGLWLEFTVYSDNSTKETLHDLTIVDDVPGFYIWPHRDDYIVGEYVKGACMARVYNPTAQCDDLASLRTHFTITINKKRASVKIHPPMVAGSPHFEVESEHFLFPLDYETQRIACRLSAKYPFSREAARTVMVSSKPVFVHVWQMIEPAEKVRGSIALKKGSSLSIQCLTKEQRASGLYAYSLLYNSSSEDKCLGEHLLTNDRALHQIHNVDACHEGTYTCVVRSNVDHDIVLVNETMLVLRDSNVGILLSAILITLLKAAIVALMALGIVVSLIALLFRTPAMKKSKIRENVRAAIIRQLKPADFDKHAPACDHPYCYAWEDCE